MCAVSMIGDHYNDKFNQWLLPASSVSTLLSFISRAEFDALKKEVEEMKALLLRAKKYDEDNNEPHCEMDEKVALLKKVADLVGVSLEDVFGNGN